MIHIADIKVIEFDKNTDELAAFMRGQRVYEILIEVERPDGEMVSINIAYEQITAYQLARIYEGGKATDSVDEEYRRKAAMYNTACKGWKWVNKPKGTADYEHGEISVQDLTVDTRTILERAICPGLGKSGDDIESDLKKARRLVGKGVRPGSPSLAEPTS